MFNDFKSPSFIIGVSILLLVPFGMGGLIYSALRNDDAQEQTSIDNSATEDNPFQELARASNLPSRAISTPETNGSRGPMPQSEAIPIGKYSNPPTTINTNDVDAPRTNKIQKSLGSDSINSFGMSDNGTIPDYNAPNSSNNFKRPSESLLDSAAENELLEVPQSNFDRSDFLTPKAEPLFQP